jgi:FkbM family methyltransferase
LSACLDAIAVAPLPCGAIWEEWVLLDGGSTDKTVEHWRAWGAAHPELTLRVQHSAERLGKAVELEQLHRLLVARRDPELLMVVCDADATVDPSAFLHLLEPFFEDPRMAVAWGVASPHGPTKRRRASRFQARLAVAVAQGLGPDAIRADGRLFAIRPSMLDGFSWRAGLIADDTQLAGYIRAAGLPRRSVCQAVTYTVAARGWRDFYLQTHRSYAAESRLSASGIYEPSDTASNGAMARLHDRRLRVQVNAFCRLAMADPVGAVAYGVARCACVALHRFSPAEFADAWPEARTTKSVSQGEPPPLPAIGQSSPVPSALRIAGEKFAVGLKVVRTCRNWPCVLGAWLANRMPVLRSVGPRDLKLRLRTGGVLRAPNTKVAAWPMLEVMVGDAYHFDRLSWSTSTQPPLSVLDIGAHVGSFTIAIAQRYPAARVICYEPSPTSAAYLRANITANHLAERVQIRQAAVASESGSVHLYSEGEGSCEATTIDPAVVGSDGRSPTVTVCPAVAFETAVSSARNVDLVKIDCEGAEYDIVLNSAPSCWDHVNCVLLEYHRVPGHSWEELACHFGELGFAVSWLEADQRRPGLGMAMLVRAEKKAPR